VASTSFLPTTLCRWTPFLHTTQMRHDTPGCPGSVDVADEPLFSIPSRCTGCLVRMWHFMQPPVSVLGRTFSSCSFPRTVFLAAKQAVSSASRGPILSFCACIPIVVAAFPSLWLGSFARVLRLVQHKICQRPVVLSPLWLPRKPCVVPTGLMM
jgi:hypothetical protein